MHACFQPILLVPAVPRKLFGSAVCDTIYTIYPSSVHKQLIQTLFEAHIVYELEETLLTNKRSRYKWAFNWTSFIIEFKR